MNPVPTLLLLLDVYLLFGVLVGFVYAFGFAGRAAGITKEALPLRVRLILIAGSIAVWPLALGRIAKGHAGGWTEGTS